MLSAAGCRSIQSLGTLSTSITSKEIEFLIALAAHEESFIYEIYADLSPRMPSCTTNEIIILASAALEELLALDIVQIGQRNLAYEEIGFWHASVLPEALQNPAEWVWSDDSGKSDFWHLWLTGQRITGKGLDAISDERARKLMFSS